MERKSELKGVRKCIKPNLSRSKSGGDWSKIKVAQNVLKQILVLEFLKSDDIFELRKIL